LVDALLSYPGHLIATMRSKTEWIVESDSKGKQRPVRVGLAPEQGKGIEYEFDLLLELSADHVGHVIKDRTGRFQDRLIDRPDEAFGTELAAWLSPEVEKPLETPAETASQNVSPEVAAQIEGLVERASRTRAWAAARDYFAKRYTGAELEYALAELEQVEREAQAEAA
jgi:hypothetical protein